MSAWVIGAMVVGAWAVLSVVAYERERATSLLESDSRAKEEEQDIISV